MDVALGHLDIRHYGYDPVVLIHVVMDVALGHWYIIQNSKSLICLNPCCNGCRTWTNPSFRWHLVDSVLILVVMDVALGLQSNLR